MVRSWPKAPHNSLGKLVDPLAGTVKAVVAVAINHDGTRRALDRCPFGIQAGQKAGAIGCFKVHIGQVAEWFHQASGQLNRALIVVGAHPEVLGANADRDGALE